jgi:hypothetical protein
MGNITGMIIHERLTNSVDVKNNEERKSTLDDV